MMVIPHHEDLAESRLHLFIHGPIGKTWLLAEFSTITKRDLEGQLPNLTCLISLHSPL